MNDINEKIKKAIEADLPNQIGEALKQKLEQAEKDKSEIKRLESKVANLEKLNNNYIETLSKWKDYEASVNQLKKDQKALQIGQLNLNHTILQAKYDSLIEHKNDISGHFALMMKNPRAIELLNTNTINAQAGYYDNNGTYIPESTEVTRVEGSIEKIEDKE